MAPVLDRIFVAHPRTVDESYFQHMRVAGWFASRLFLAGGAALVHALVPCLFEKTAGRMVAAIHRRLEARH